MVLKSALHTPTFSLHCLLSPERNTHQQFNMRDDKVQAYFQQTKQVEIKKMERSSIFPANKTTVKAQPLVFKPVVSWGLTSVPLVLQVLKQLSLLSPSKGWTAKKGSCHLCSSDWKSDGETTKDPNWKHRPGKSEVCTGEPETLLGWASDPLGLQMVCICGHLMEFITGGSLYESPFPSS